MSTDTHKELKSIVGEIPNYIFESLELSDDIKREWKLGAKASDFGSHNQFVQKYSQRLEQLINTEINQTLDRLKATIEHDIKVTTVQNIEPLANGQYVKVPNMVAAIEKERRL